MTLFAYLHRQGQTILLVTHEWDIAELNGGVIAVGVGSGVTGHGGQLIIIDDPVKSRKEAESETYRQNLKNWYTDDLLTRLEIDPRRVAIEHNLAILKRQKFPDVVVREGDTVEIVNFVGGG